MANNNFAEAANAQLGIPLPLAYGYNRARGNNVLLQQLASNNRITFYILGDGEWAGPDTVWVNSKPINLADTTLFHFHPGIDGVLGSGLNPTSTGGDQAVDAFFSNLPASYQRLTFSRKAYIALNVPPDPGAPNANLDVVGDYRCLKVRIFDANGNQTGYQFSTNGAWQILDLILRKMLKPEWNPVLTAAAGGDLTAQEKLRIDFPSVVDSAAWCDFQIGNGLKRWESSVAFPRTVKMQQAVAQMQTMSQLFVHESFGKIYIRADKPRSSTFLLTSDHVVPGTTKFDKVDLHGTTNRLIASFNDLMPQDQADIDTVANSGIVRSSNQVTVKTIGTHPYLVGDNVQIWNQQTDLTLNAIWPITSVPDANHFGFAQGGPNETVGGGSTGTPESRFAQRSSTVDHERHQNAIGQRGLNLNAVFRRLPLNIDFGNNTMERVTRALNFLKIRNLGVDAVPYNAPRTGKLSVFFDSVDSSYRALAAQLVGDILTVDSTVSEEFQGDYEIIEATVVLPSQSSSSNNSGGSGAAQNDVPTIDLKLLQYIPSAFSDVSTSDTTVKASISRRGLSPITAVDSSGIQRLAGTFRNNPTNVNGYFTGSNPLSQSGTSTTINVGSSAIQYGDGQVSYNSGSVNPGSYGTWIVYCIDLSFAGGSVVYLATTTKSTLTSSNGVVFFGQISTSSGGGGLGIGGGGGSCFSGGTRVRTPAGLARFDDLPLICEVETECGAFVADLIVSDYDGDMLVMESGDLVTPGHLIKMGSPSRWVPASSRWSESVKFKGKVYTLRVRTEKEEERHFILADGTVAHNVSNLS